MYTLTHVLDYTSKQVSLGNSPRSGMAEPKGVRIFDFIRAYQIPSQNDYSIYTPMNPHSIKLQFSNTNS